jgi:UDP:flavonoid glycosyltransferase YjiC (YdhE family)
VRIVISTLGFLGDVLPLLAIARELENRGANVIIASTENHRDATQSRGFSFASLGDDPGDVPVDATLDDGYAFIDHVNFRSLRLQYENLYDITADADLLLSTYFVVSAHLAAEARKIPYVACALSPAFLFNVAQERAPPRRPPTSWHREVAKLRSSVGLPSRPFPYAGVLDQQAHTLGLFPRLLVADTWKSRLNINIVGYPHLRTPEVMVADSELEAFCDDDTIAFTFGTNADKSNVGQIFSASVNACRRLGLKCLYLSRFVDPRLMEGCGGADVLVRSFVDHDAVLPRVGAMVHHAGLGSTMAACRHGKAMVLAPFRFDQPLHAARLRELIDVECVPLRDYREEALVAALDRTLANRQRITSRLAELMTNEVDGAAEAARISLSLIPAR